MGPLYKRFICIREPNLCFIGLGEGSPVGVFILELQARIMKHIIEGKIQLPSKEAMLQSFIQDVDDLRFKYNKPIQTFYQMPSPQFDRELWEDLRNILKPICANDEEKRTVFVESLEKALRHLRELLLNKGIISYKMFNFLYVLNN